MLDGCRQRTRHGKHHFVPYTRFAEGEIRALMERASEWVSLTQGTVWDNEIPQHLRVRGETDESLPFVGERWDNVSEGEFQKLWRRGEPLVLSGCLERMEIQWTPEYFIEHYGGQNCHLVNCEQSQVIQATVKKFFENFEKGELYGHRTLKLKDWPPKADFKTEFPALFEDFERALPFPRYTRRTGFFNIASRFPLAYLPPDLGPKMYNAYASSDEEGGAGTTNLHLDMTDAINIMAYAAGRPPEGREGCAVWDIFPAEATGVLREFIKTEIIKDGKGGKGGEGVRDIDDPVLRQRFYLTRPHLALLRAKYGIRPHRIYQSPGDAVFIPAGCAHQVCNLTSCIKVACDFVSPENVSRCEVITRENRGLRERCKREDVLQLSNVVYFGWKDLEEGLVGAQAGQNTPPVPAQEEGEQQTI
ncbi:Clavaminate synthase-like protein [Saitoella complicata NRRL Y-17804]|nr:Clavaminate synthase-like protein [Saitoella complicata NRRL Y-17804]ODQ50522.1 Clavaminate synthase-like protein [Saitoella complicata NRRL Y-17804]